MHGLSVENIVVSAGVATLDEVLSAQRTAVAHHVVFVPVYATSWLRLTGVWIRVKNVRHLSRSPSAPSLYWSVTVLYGTPDAFFFACQLQRRKNISLFWNEEVHRSQIGYVLRIAHTLEFEHLNPEVALFYPIGFLSGFRFLDTLPTVLFFLCVQQTLVVINLLFAVVLLLSKGQFLARNVRMKSIGVYQRPGEKAHEYGNQFVPAKT